MSYVYHSEKYSDPLVTKKIDDILNDPQTDNRDIDFIKSVKGYWEKNKYITVRQLDALNRISDKKVEKNLDEDFRKNFSVEQREILNIVAAYYSRENMYYATIAHRVMKDPNYIPTQKQYENMCCNKYSLSLVENYRTEPKFNNGQIVCVRDTYRGFQFIPGQVLMIVEPNGNVGPAKGSREYKVVPLGKLETTIAEERELKTYRN